MDRTNQSDFDLPLILHGAREKRSNEEFIADERDRVRPSEFVQRKLQIILRTRNIPVSCMHTERLIRRPALFRN